MFYSHTLLAKKGPLGTVWCAAHFQNRLKKSQVTTTDISRAVERIMFPEAPIALRLSGHLLLGVVRIYSMKVEYLHLDSVAVKKGAWTYSTSMVNLPQDADKAPIHAVTLPETFDLDAYDFDDEFDTSRFRDNHLRSQEEITLTGRISAEYVGITIGEILQDLSHHENRPEPEPMEEDTEPIVSVATTPPHFRDPGPSNQTVDNEISFEELPPEYRLDAGHDFPSLNMDEQLERDTVLEEHIRSDKEMLTPNAASREKSTPESQSLLSDHHQEPPPASDHGYDIFEEAPSSSPQHHQESPRTVFEEGNEMSNFRLVESAVHAEQQQLVNRRGIKPLLFDNDTVLKNEFYKTALKETGDIRRKRRNCPHSAYGIWKFNKRLKKDKVFFDGIFTGLSDDLNRMLTEDIISSKPHLISTEPIQSDPNAPSTSDPNVPSASDPNIPSTSDHEDEFHEEMEHQRNAGQAFSPHSTLMPCNNSARTDDFTPAPNTANFGSEQATTASRTENPLTSDVDEHTGSYVSDMETPAPETEDRFGFDSTVGLSDIPEMNDSANGELSFLEDDKTPPGSQGTPEADFLLREENASPEINALSLRTRAVAQFLMKKMSDTASTDDESAELSLIKTLEGKTRKVSARMFYETLVLKSCGLLDLDQQEAYGDITLKLTSRLSKEQFSA